MAEQSFRKPAFAKRRKTMAGLLLEVAATAAYRIHFAKAKCLQESKEKYAKPVRQQ
jgi:hypothetical protein